MELYPLKFEPILKHVLWGGSKICQLKQLECLQNDIGESWELSNLNGSVSVISNGYLKGKRLSEIMEEYGASLVGTKVFTKFGVKFPLLVKFIDAESDLSIQVHPDDALAAARGLDFGKTEMWYVLEAMPGAKLISGFSKDLSSDEYVDRIANNTIEEVMQCFEPQSGEVYYIPAGRVHALGAGLLIVEIQQSSDTTYRLYDYNRRDVHGNLRELHTDLAKDALNYKHELDARVEYDASKNGFSPILACEYFSTNRIHLKAETFDSKQKPIDELERDYSKLDSFVVFVCMKGSGQVLCGDHTISMLQGETLLLPALIEGAVLSTSHEFLLLEIYIQI